MMSNFHLVCDMNIAFGNPSGSPHRIDALKLKRQISNVLKEHEEFLKALEAGDVDQVRDSICDMMVFCYGGYHIMGYDADADMTEVINALYSRFVRDEEHLEATKKHFDALGVKYYTQGSFPRMCLKSAEDQGNGEYPKGKFLKAVGYREPKFYQVPPPLPVSPVKVDELQATREKEVKTREATFADIDEKVRQYRTQLESEAFGLPAFDDKQGNHHLYTPPKD